MKTETFLEEKAALIHLVEWYRDDYHPKSMYPLDQDLIEDIKKCNNERELDLYWQITDSWLDY